MNFIDLSQTITDQGLDKKCTSMDYDIIARIAEYKLNNEQFNKLSDAEKQQYNEARDKLIQQQKDRFNLEYKKFREDRKRRLGGTKRQQRCNHMFNAKTRQGLIYCSKCKKHQ